jgi:hypothetical protein
MKIANEKTTIYLDPKVKKSVQYYALRDSRSLSEIINERLHEYLEDMADVAALDEARKHPAEYVPLEQVVQELGLDLHEIRGKTPSSRKKTAKAN